MIATDYRVLGTIPMLVAVCLVTVSTQAKYGGSVCEAGVKLGLAENGFCDGGQGSYNGDKL